MPPPGGVRSLSRSRSADGNRSRAAPAASGGNRGAGWARGISGRARNIGVSRASPGAGYHAGTTPGLAAATRSVQAAGGRRQANRPDYARLDADLTAARQAAQYANPRHDRDLLGAVDRAWLARSTAILGDASHPEHAAFQRSAAIGEGVLNLAPMALSFIGGPAGFLAAQGFNAMTGRGAAGKLTGGVMGPVPESRFSLSGAMDWARGMFSGGGGAEAASLRRHEMSARR